MPNLRSAVLLIDFQNEFTTKGGKLYDDVSDILENTNMIPKVIDLVGEARGRGSMIIHSPITIDPTDQGQDNEHAIMSTLREKKFFEGNTWNIETSEDMPIVASDYVMQHRKTTSVWNGTALKTILQKESIDILFIAGFLTDICVLQAVQEANELLYKGSTSNDDKFFGERKMQIVVLSDGTAATSNQLHLNMITNVLPKYCNVTTVDDAKKILDRNTKYNIQNVRMSNVLSTFNPIKKLRMAMLDKWLPGDQLLRFLDHDRDGNISYREFHDFLFHFSLLTDEIDPELIFDILDINKNGEVPNELVLDALTAREEDVEEEIGTDCMDMVKSQNLKPFPSPYYICLIAHKDMKPAMMKFVKDNISFFSRVKLVTTGSTARGLKSLGLDASHLVASSVLGGYQEIGGLITQNKVCSVFFFLDPLHSHPHACDIEALNRICCVHNVMFANNPGTATALVHSMQYTAFGYSQLCGINQNCKMDSEIVKKYKDHQKKVIAAVSAHDNGNDKKLEDSINNNGKLVDSIVDDEGLKDSIPDDTSISLEEVFLEFEKESKAGSTRTQNTMMSTQTFNESGRDSICDLTKVKNCTRSSLTSNISLPNLLETTASTAGFSYMDDDDDDNDDNEDDDNNIIIKNKASKKKRRSWISSFKLLPSWRKVRRQKIDQ